MGLDRDIAVIAPGEESSNLCVLDRETGELRARIDGEQVELEAIARDVLFFSRELTTPDVVSLEAEPWRELVAPTRGGTVLWSRTMEMEPRPEDLFGVSRFRVLPAPGRLLVALPHPPHLVCLGP